MTFTVAIVGRPNVGKSTLFNRLVGRKLALVHDEPGVTRDRREGEGAIADLHFRIIDTAGLEDAKAGSLEARMVRQTEAAIADADVCLFLIDARVGVTPLDEHFAELLRRQPTPVILVANKCEGGKGEAGLLDAFKLGLGEPLPLSAEHGEGLSLLYDALLPYESEEEAGEELAAEEGKEEGEQEGEEEIDESRPLRIAIVGRPNAGKSTLINRLIGEERLLTGPEAGITRDSISVEWEWQGRPVRLFDTAGMRRRARVTEKLEKLSVSDALRAIRFAEVVVLMLDATMPFEKQDLQIADMIVREGRALVIALNKWDLVDEPQKAMADLREMAERLLPQVRGVPLVQVSGLTGRGLDKLMQAARDVYRYWNTRVPTGELNRWLEEVTERHPPPASKGRRIRLRYITQPKSRPPTFVIFCQRAGEVPESYMRYLANSLREAFHIPAVPLRVMLRKGKNPYANRAKKR